MGGGLEELQVTTILHTSLMATRAHAILSLQESSFYHQIITSREGAAGAIRHTGEGRAPKFTCAELSTDYKIK